VPAAGGILRAGVREVVFDAGTIAERVSELAAEIESVYEPPDRLLLVGLLKGSFMFLADLARAFEMPVQVDFLSVSSYGDGTESSGTVRIECDTRLPVADRNVLLVEDILDSGTTLDRVVELMRQRGARTVESCTLLHKRLATSVHEPRFVGFDAPNAFLVGYGLDHAEDFRHLPYIASL
jgi:hypoxanthine phosphoribosyltransferase